MKLYRLSFAGIGPFRDRVDLDFEALSDGGLFLIEGATGSGKSTIIDAIAYALYGSVLGSGSKARMTSDFRSPQESAPPFIDLTFETAQGLYRVRREPEHSRPRLRGQGDTGVAATAVLLPITADQIDTATADLSQLPLASGPREVNMAMPGLVGLTASQFAQTIVLPQGQFTTFLESKDDERRVILERLFDTGLYSRVMDAVVQRAADASAGFAQAEAALRTTLSHFHEAAGLPSDPESLALVERPDELLVHTAAILTALEDAARRDEADATAAKDAREQAERHHGALVTRRGLVAERRAADERAAELAGRADEVAAAGAAVDALARAAVPAERRALAAQRERDRVRADEALQAILGRRPDLAEVDSGEVESRRTDLLGEAGALDDLVALEAGLDARQDQLHEATASLTRSQTTLSDLEAQAQTLPATIAALDGELAESRASAGHLAVHEATLADARTRLANALGAVAVREQVTAAMKVAESAVTDAAAASADYAGLYAAFLSSTAAELALTLQPGDACLVCGSTEHPRPAQGLVDGRSITRAELEGASRRRDEADAELQRHTEEVERLRSDAERLELLAGLSVADAQSAVAVAEGDVGVAEAAATRVRELEARRATAVDDLGRVQGDARSLGVTIAVEEARIESERLTLAADREAVAAARGEHATVASLIAARRAEAQTLADLGAALRDAALARGALTEAREAAAAALAEFGFADDEALDEALAHAPRRDELDALVSGHRDALAAVGRDLERLATVDATEEVDPEPAAEALRIAVAEQERTAAVAAVSAGAARAAAGHRATIAERCADLAHDREQSKALIDLARLVQGGNRNLSLPLFVVIRRFREVVEAANTHLASMLGGRLSLVSHSEQVDGRTRFGLGLRVVDGLSGTARDTASVSGGEGFCCALSLALGLAEVVLLESGGLRADTLFVDEGFGTLDQGTLQLVISELDELRDGGRMVGVVSHVSQMHEQIHRQIRVSRSDEGPSRVMVTGV